MTATLDRPQLSDVAGPTWRDRLQPLVTGSGGWGATLLVTALGGLLRFLRLDLPGLDFFACPLRAATGMPCPGCGATHAFVLLAHGDLAGALFASPLWACIALGLWAHAGLTLLRLLGLRRALVLSLPAERSRPARLLVGALIVANWAFVVFVSRGGAR